MVYTKRVSYRLVLDRTQVRSIKLANKIKPTLFLYIIGRKCSTSQPERGGIEGAFNDKNKN